MNSTDEPQPLNLNTPYAWLPPSLASQYEASCFLYVAVLGAWIWDILMSISEEYRLVFRSRFTFPQAAYIVARISSFSFILTSTIFQVASVDNCSALQKALGWSAAVAIPANSLLFFIRIRAVFYHNKPALAFFAFLWFSTCISIVIPFGIDGAHIGNTRRCINSLAKRYSGGPIIVSAVHDTVVFAAITWQILWYSIAETTWSARLRSFVSGEGMGSMSKALLQTGQIYYLVTVGMNIVTPSMLLLSTGPPVIHAMFTVPNLALENAMACRVFRKLKLGLIAEHPALTEEYALSTFRAASGIPKRSKGGGTNGDSVELRTVIHSLPSSYDSEQTKKGSLAINVTQKTETDSSSYFETRKPYVEGEV